MLSVSCPTCRREVPWSGTSAWRPFCSARCKGIDLGEWASDRFVIAGESTSEVDNGRLGGDEHASGVR